MKRNETKFSTESVNMHVYNVELGLPEKTGIHEATKGGHNIFAFRQRSCGFFHTESDYIGLFFNHRLFSFF